MGKSNATVGYQFIALASGKLFGKQRDFEPVCCSSGSGDLVCKKCRHVEQYVGIFGIRRKYNCMCQHVLFVCCSSFDKRDLYDNALKKS